LLQPGELHVFEPEEVDLSELSERTLIWRADDAQGVEVVRECDETDNEVLLATESTE
jgi:hypothetical protein